jgi:hypothetical protein
MTTTVIEQGRREIARSQGQDVPRDVVIVKQEKRCFTICCTLCNDADRIYILNLSNHISRKFKGLLGRLLWP